MSPGVAGERVLAGQLDYLNPPPAECKVNLWHVGGADQQLKRWYLGMGGAMVQPWAWINASSLVVSW